MLYCVDCWMEKPAAYTLNLPCPPTLVTEAAGSSKRLAPK